MDIEIIRKLRLAYPFRQFYVILKDGRRLFVGKPYHVAVAVDGSHLMICSDGPESHHLWPEELADVDVLPAARSSA